MQSKTERLHVNLYKTGNNPAPAPAQGCFLLNYSFSLSLSLTGGQALGVSKAPVDNCDCNRYYRNKGKLNLKWGTL